MAIYMHFDGIQGDATHEQHKKWLTIGSCQFGVGRGVSTPTGSAANRESSEPSVSEITVTRNSDAATPKFITAACVGKEGKLVKLHFVSTGNPGDTYLEYTLHNTLVSAYSASSGGEQPSESISLNFTKIEVKYTPYDDKHKAGNPIAMYYDLASTKAG